MRKREVILALYTLQFVYHVYIDAKVWFTMPFIPVLCLCVHEFPGKLLNGVSGEVKAGKYFYKSVRNETRDVHYRTMSHK
ncbi:MAG: hypothetical protein JXJ04_08195 [Spirochaetales bacterium]|nr:hypothetical protein [Spirochaetales bacterium]